MALSKGDCRVLRVVVNRTRMGPAWFNDTPEDPQMRALHAELRFQTQEWLRANVGRELNNLMPINERVKP